MKILVKSRKFIEELISLCEKEINNFNFISIYSKNSFSPLPNQNNILKLEFDDVSEQNIEGFPFKTNLLWFSEKQAVEIFDFVNKIDCSKLLYVHCDAGISRSGAVGMILNDYFNRFEDDNKEDFKYFNTNNSHIMPNPRVVRLMKSVFFGYPSTF